LALQASERDNAQVILNQAIESGRAMLSELLGKDVGISITSVDSIDAGGLGSLFPGRNLAAPAEIGDALGTAALIISEGQAAIMADLMIGQDGSNPPASLEDLHLSAVTELTGQVNDAIAGSMGSQTAASMSVSPLDVSVVDLDAGIIPALDGDVLVVEADISIGELGSGKMGFVVSGEAAEMIKGGAKAEASIEGFVSDVTAGGGEKKKVSANAQNIVASELRDEAKPTVYDKSLDIVMDVPLQVTVELGRTEKLVRDVLEMSPGSVIELDKLAGEPVDILVNNKHIAKGEVVVIDENFGIRITDIIRPAERIPRL